MFYTEKANVFYHVTQVNLVCPDKKKYIFFHENETYFSK